VPSSKLQFISTMEKESILKFDDFPNELKEFISQNGIQPDAYDVKQLNRFFRCELLDEASWPWKLT
jgi:hypothetical protein